MKDYFDSDEGLDGYFVKVGSDFVYIPSDQVQWLTVNSSGQIYNISSNTIYCYALDANGNRGSQYRINSFGTMEKYNYYSNQWNTWWQWDSVSALAADSNITYGQTGIHSVTDFLLFGILLLLGIGILVRGLKK